MGLVGYVAHGIEEFGVRLNPGIVAAGAVPVALLIVGLIVHRIRSHKE